MNIEKTFLFLPVVISSSVTLPLKHIYLWASGDKYRNIFL